MSVRLVCPACGEGDRLCEVQRVIASQRVGGVVLDPAYPDNPEWSDIDYGDIEVCWDAGTETLSLDCDCGWSGSSYGDLARQHQCETCDGSGNNPEPIGEGEFTSNEICADCDGAGVVREVKTA